MHANDFTTALDSLVADYTNKIKGLAQDHALWVISKAFGGPSAPAPTNQAVPSSGTRGKRTSENLDALCDKIAGFVAANPGLRIEQINKQLGTKTKNLALPIRKLLASGRVKSKGQKRSTTYFPGKAKSKR